MSFSSTLQISPQVGAGCSLLSSPPAKPVSGTSLPPCGVEDRSAGDRERP